MSNENRIKVKFNIFKTGRDYTNKERGYILDNVKEVINSPQVQERVKTRQLFGYYGHTMRELAGKLALGAKNVLKLPSGQEIVADAVPGCVCTHLAIDDEGNVTHEQEVLTNTDEGKSIMALHNSKVGGFSWASSGGVFDGNTLISDLLGFDYVPNPLNLNNNGYGLVLDSDDSDAVLSRDKVLKTLKQNGVDKPGTVLDSWYASEALALHNTQLENQDLRLLANERSMRISEMEQQVLDALAVQNDLKEVNTQYTEATEKLETLRKSIPEELREKSAQVLDEYKASEADTRKAFFKDVAAESSINIPEPIMDALVTGEDKSAVVSFLNGLAGIDTSHLPLGKKPADYVTPKSFGSDSDADTDAFYAMPTMSM